MGGESGGVIGMMEASGSLIAGENSTFFGPFWAQIFLLESATSLPIAGTGNHHFAQINFFVAPNQEEITRTVP